MIKEDYLKPFYEEHAQRYLSGYFSVEKAISFLKSLSDEQIRTIGNSLFYIYPAKYSRQFVNRRNEGEDYSFADKFRKDYGLPSKYTIKDRGRAKALHRMLGRDDNLTGAEFFKIMNIEIE